MLSVDAPITFDTHPDRYKHWRLTVQGVVATLALDVAEDAGIRPGYTLKLNSYDLGVDLELHDALNRIRFEYPAVRCVVVTSAKERVFCSGANIYMLGASTHAWKVNFCKFTNETRCAMEDASRYSGIRFLAACNGSTAGGGYELALACDEIVLVDDQSSSVSLPEVSLLGVLPATGGLTRLTDKRKVRRDLADVFCTTTEGVKAERAKAWRLVDAVVKTKDFAAFVERRAAELARTSDRPSDAHGVTLPPLERSWNDAGFHYRHVDVRIDRSVRTATITVSAPQEPSSSSDIDAILSCCAAWWPLQMARELDDAILLLRTNEPEIGTWLLETRGEPAAVLAIDDALAAHAGHWFVREVIGMLRRTFSRLDVSSRSIFALVERGSCFAGTLLELALAADRAYMVMADDGPQVVLSWLNFGALAQANDRARIETKLSGDDAGFAAARAHVGKRIGAQTALELGLVTSTPDDLDWRDEIRLAVEERTSMSPDALSGLEANLRFPLYETMSTRIFGRLSAWQNWIFSRPNAVGDDGALKGFGKGTRPQFDWRRA